MIFAFPSSLAPWLTPVDMVSTVTPLRVFRDTGTITTSLWDMFIGNIGGSMGEMSVIAIVIGAAYLIYKKHANYRIPAGIVGAMVVSSLLLGQDPLFHLFTGSVLFGAFFMATDPATSPKSDTGKWIHGIMIGLMIMSIRMWGWVPEGTTFAILGMNYLVPFINTETDRIKAEKAKKTVTKQG